MELKAAEMLDLRILSKKEKCQRWNFLGFEAKLDQNEKNRGKSLWLQLKEREISGQRRENKIFHN